MKKEENLKELPFEEALEKLEKIVTSLENGDTPLENSIQLFEKGMNLAYVCNEKLEKAEQQVDVLVKERGSWTKKPWEKAGAEHD